MRFFGYATDDVPHFRHCEPAKQSRDNQFIMVLSGLLPESSSGLLAMTSDSKRHFRLFGGTLSPFAMTWKNDLT